MSTRSRLSSVVGWAITALRFVGGGAAVWAAAELFTGDPWALHLVGPVRWPLFGGLVVASCLALFSGWRDLVRPTPERAVGQELRHVVVLFVLAVAAQVLASTSFKPFLCLALFGLAAGAFGAISLVERARPGWFRRRWVRWLDLLSFQFCFTLLLLELSLRLLAVLVPGPMFARDDSSVDDAMAMYRYAPGTVRHGFVFNSDGHYDEEFAPREQVVVSVGDSFSVGVVPHHFHFTTACERELESVAIHNLGIAGIGPGGYLRLLQQGGLELGPDLVLVNLFLGNDVMEARRFAASRGFFRSFCDRRNLLVYQVPIRLMRMLRGEDRGAGKDLVGELPGEATLVTSDPEALASAMPWLRDPLLERPQMSESEFLRVESDRAGAIGDLERVGDYARFFGALREILRAVGEVPVAVMLIPDEFQVEDELWQQVSDRLQRTDLDRDQPQRRIVEWLRDEGVACLDLLPILRAVPPMADGNRHLYHLRDTHFNARGNEVVGEALAEFLRDQLR